ncbi:hypothetical protein L208DRAFT_1343238 [Tricholoma matsutake]|nr:hypothetical protein L208DRAFT_1343238 [Tricholoma matsutake 945]
MNQERVEHLQKGLCFICHQPGHRSSDHRDGKNPTQMGFLEQWPDTMPVTTVVSLGSVLLATMNRQSMCLSIQVAESDNGKDITMNALLNSGAGGVFIDLKFIKQEGIRTYPLGRTIWATNVDGTLNRQGTITRCMKGRLHINGRSYPMEYLVTGLGKESVILGLPWLQEINLIIEWKKGTFEFRDEERWAQIKRILEKTRRAKWALPNTLNLPRVDTGREAPNDKMA